MTHEQKKSTWWTFAAIFLGGIFAMCLIFSSCSPVKRIGGLAAKHPDAAKRVCGDMFPGETKTETETLFLPGKEVYHFDTVTANCDTVIKWVNGKPMQVIRRVSVPCPPSITRIDTVVKKVSVSFINKAKEDVLTKDLADCRADMDRLKNGRNSWRYIAIAALAVLLGATLLKLFLGKNKLINKIM